MSSNGPGHVGVPGVGGRGLGDNARPRAHFLWTEARCLATAVSARWAGRVDASRLRELSPVAVAAWLGDGPQTLLAVRVD